MSGPTPEKLAASGTEDGHQIALFAWAALNFDKYPELKWMYHCPNGGSRNKAEAGKFKAMGVKRGVPDIFLPVPRKGYHGLYIELKVGKGVTSVDQDLWAMELVRQGYKVQLCYGWEAARDALINYLEVEHD